ncbi:hypothetical protein, partial [Klebsiella pneumoniae]|uniref:hypothetical protein n=1 Tax=Klebsiella pneumoniae TaxID=573 RepID=UPI003857B2C3
MNYNNGDFYIAISPMSAMSAESTRSDGTHRPIGVRCDTREGIIGSGENLPTLAIIFSAPSQ